MFYQKVDDKLISLTTPVKGDLRPSTTVGSMYYYTGKEAPEGWLFCRGQSVLKKDYPELYEVIGDTYGSTATTFNLPDLRGYAPAGVGQSSRSDTTHDVYTLGQKKEAQVASHCHVQNQHGHGAANHTHTFNHTHCLWHSHCNYGSVSSLCRTICYYTGCCLSSTWQDRISTNVTVTTNCTFCSKPTESTAGYSTTTTGLSTSNTTIENVAFGASSGGTHGNRVSLNVIIYTGE